MEDRMEDRSSIFYPLSSILYPLSSILNPQSSIFTTAAFLAEIASQLPQLREKLSLDSLLQISCAFAAPRPGFAAYHTLDHLDVTQPPHRKHLIVFDQAFRQQE